MAISIHISTQYNQHHASENKFGASIQVDVNLIYSIDTLNNIFSNGRLYLEGVRVGLLVMTLHTHIHYVLSRSIIFLTKFRRIWH
ncbi:hypothetical protein NP493_410g01000 [Ridgeia piscesae]|uniref:Uncharacterized protein n=1 Tax=Ridgeia piscesae TaxID=27915 RepID=A0AAD9L0P1_RIDPI|nr:hypothetical protein NP493_410g01000 [Ridgeia piscesae]